MKFNFIDIVFSFLTVDNILKLIGIGLGKLIIWARKRDCWSMLKTIIHKLRGWLDIIDAVIEDDTLTEDEEKLVIDALRNTKEVAKLEEVIDRINK